jgi:hypothetical protein
MKAESQERIVNCWPGQKFFTLSSTKRNENQRTFIVKLVQSAEALFVHAKRVNKKWRKGHA